MVRTAQLINTSQSLRRAELESGGDQFLVPSAVELPGGELTAIEVTFAPTAEGVTSATIRVRDGEQVLELAVRGEGRRPPSCPPSSLDCHALLPNDEGDCIDALVPDGSACTAACVEGGTCRQGVCVGAARSCDDHDACTADRCSNEKGCLHETISCPSSDRCHAPMCDRLGGCGTVEVKDGTACGSNDCATAHVCLSGTCRAVTAPDGSECSAATLCRGPGVCRNGACDQPPPTPLRPVWQVRAATTETLVFPGVADRLGNVFWITVGPTTTALVSVDRDGRSRFSVPLQGLPSVGSTLFGAPDTPLVLINDDLLAVVVVTDRNTGDGSRVEVRSTRTGALQFAKGRADFEGPLQLASAARFWVMGLGTVGVPARLWLELRTNMGGASWRSWIVALDPAAGVMLWNVPGSYFEQVIADDSAVYVHEALFSQSLWAVDANGHQLWAQTPSSSLTLSSASNGVVLTAYPAVLRDAATGVGVAVDAGLPVTSLTLRGDDRLVSVDTSTFCRQWLASVDPRTGTAVVPWQSTNLRCLGEPLLTSRQSLLVGVSSPAEVLEVGLDGSSHFTCPLSDVAVGAAVLHGNRWIVTDGQGRVHAYDLPVPGLATRGWVSFHGSLSRSRRPLD